MTDEKTYEARPVAQTLMYKLDRELHVTLHDQNTRVFEDSLTAALDNAYAAGKKGGVSTPLREAVDAALSSMDEGDVGITFINFMETMRTAFIADKKRGDANYRDGFKDGWREACASVSDAITVESISPEKPSRFDILAASLQIVRVRKVVLEVKSRAESLEGA